MGEIFIACFIGAWLTVAGIAAHKHLRKEYGELGDAKR